LKTVFLDSVLTGVDANRRENVASLALQKEELEIALSETKLGMSIESVREHVTRFNFHYIDGRSWDRTFSIVLDLSTKRYLLQSCEPMLDGLASLLEELNRTNDFIAFLQQVRRSFAELVKAKTKP